MEERDAKSKRACLLISVFVNIAILFTFKYFNFFNGSLAALFGYCNISYKVRSLDILLPVGISFYTFQILSYSIDVYMGNKKPEKHLGIFALYVTFFPQLVAGPIERSTVLLPQFYKKHIFDYKRVTDGLKLMAWGFFQKLVIADRLAVFVNQIYNHPNSYTGFPLIIATYFFAFQIYCDFSGYSDIAIGAAQVMGFELMKNFKQPYFSKSVSEFWRRWHISLSYWFKDYVYIPMGGNRVAVWRWYFNLFILFFISGLWHGANWTFVIWGVLHGFYIVFSHCTVSFRKKVSNNFYLNKLPRVEKFLKVSITFHLVLFAWIFFRANSLNDAYYIITHLFSNLELKSLYWELGNFSRFDFTVAIASIFLLKYIHYLQGFISIRQYVSQRPAWLRWVIYYMAVCGIMLFGKFGAPGFVYFQF